MSDGTKIEWTDATWNPVTGCSVHSPGCTNCYAMKLAGTRLKHVASRAGLTRETKAGPVWTGEVRFNEAELLKPLSWRRPRMIFVCAHGDLFHENVPDGWIDQVFAVLALCPQHTFQVLTKRSARMQEYVTALIDGRRGVLCAMSDLGAPSVMANAAALWGAEDANRRRPLPNVWLGVSVEDQVRADERVPDLLATPAAVRWLSCEPLLGAVDLEPWLPWPSAFTEVPNGDQWGCVHCDDPCAACPEAKAYFHVEEGPPDAHGCPEWMTHERRTLDWIVAGGESGPGARPMHPDWARSLRDQCAAARVPFFFKQWGQWSPDFDNNDFRWLRQNVFNGEHRELMAMVGKKAAGRHLDGQLHEAMPSLP